MMQFEHDEVLPEDLQELNGQRIQRLAYAMYRADYGEARVPSWNELTEGERLSYLGYARATLSGFAPGKPPREALDKALEFRDSMIKLQTSTGMPQETIQQIKESLLEMSNPRNTQFLGSATKALNKVSLVIMDTTLPIEEQYRRANEILAQYAYDLACHTIKTQAYGMDLFCVNDPEWIRERVEPIPDMTA